MKQSQDGDSDSGERPNDMRENQEANGGIEFDRATRMHRGVVVRFWIARSADDVLGDSGSSHTQCDRVRKSSENG